MANMSDSDSDYFLENSDEFDVSKGDISDSVVSEDEEIEDGGVRPYLFEPEADEVEQNDSKTDDHDQVHVDVNRQTDLSW